MKTEISTFYITKTNWLINRLLNVFQVLQHWLFISEMSIVFAEMPKCASFGVKYFSYNHNIADMFYQVKWYQGKVIL